MKQISQHQKVAILRIMRDAGDKVGSKAISQALTDAGLDMQPRTIRLYLERLEADGLVTSSARGRTGGRSITRAGLKEIEDAQVAERVGLSAARVDALAYGMSFNAATRSGTIILNVSTISERSLTRAIREISRTFGCRLGISQYLTLFHQGDTIGNVRIPSGKIGIGTVCSMTLNGILLNERIPTSSRFAGVLELEAGRPVRFTDVIHYTGTSLDPLSVFIKSGLLSVRDVVNHGNGRIGASFREIPACAREQAMGVFSRTEKGRLGQPILIGLPGRPLLAMPVQEGCLGIILAGGLNPIAAAEETGIPTQNHGSACLFPFERLHHYRDLAAELGITLSR